MTGAPICYLAQPIDFQQGIEPTFAEYIRRCLTRAGFVVYNPACAFQTPSSAEPNPNLQRINDAALDLADALVAMYPEDKTIGVPMELQRAVLAGKPTLVITRAISRSWVLASLAQYAHVRITRYPGKGELFDWLREEVIRRQSCPVRPMSPLPFLVQEGAQLPDQSYEGDAGFDLYTIGGHLIEPGEFVDVPVGCSVQLPDRVWGFLVGRSSTLRKHELLVNPAIIDTGWRGPLYAGVRNMGPAVFEVKQGMRLAQLIPLPNLAVGLAPVQVQQLDPSERGTAGFGSSGE